MLTKHDNHAYKYFQGVRVFYLVKPQRPALLLHVHAHVPRDVSHQPTRNRTGNTLGAAA